MTPFQSAVEAQQRAINLLSGMGGYDGTVAALIGPDALQSLLLAQPREYDAESIKSAPEGVYCTGSKFNDGRIAWWGYRDCIPKAYLELRISSWAARYPGIDLVFFGPVTQPPKRVLKPESELA